jgi:hypothetical protein
MEAEETIPPADGKSEGSGVAEGTVGADGKSEGSGVEGAVGAVGHGISEGSGVEGAVGAVEAASSDVWPEPRKRYVEAVQAEHLYGAIAAIDVHCLTRTTSGSINFSMS